VRARAREACVARFWDRELNMRTTLITLAKLIGLVVLHVVLFGAGAAFFVGDNVPGGAAQQESALTPLFLVAIAAVDVAVLALLAARSRLHGWRLAVLLVGAFYFTKTFTSMLEAAYFMKNVSAETLPGLFAMTLPLALLLPPLVAWAFGRGARAGEAAPRRPKLPTGELVAKVAVLSIVVYPALFFSFGYFVAWQSPAVRAFYGSPAATTFVQQMASVVVDTPELLLFEAFRGLLWVLCALPILRTTRGRPWVGGALVAALFALVQNDVHWMPNPLMPPEVRFFHFWETSISNALFAAAIAGLLSRSHAPRAASRLTRASSVSMRTSS
jgi:hypothetical protein